MPNGVVTSATGLETVWGCNDCAQCVKIVQECSVTLTSKGSRQNDPKFGSWTVVPSDGTMILDPSPLAADNGGPYWAARCCDAPEGKCGDLTLDLGAGYALADATLVIGGWRPACEVTCTFSDGSNHTFSQAGTFPSSCTGAKQL